MHAFSLRRLAVVLIGLGALAVQSTWAQEPPSIASPGDAAEVPADPVERRAAEFTERTRRMMLGDADRIREASARRARAAMKSRRYPCSSRRRSRFRRPLSSDKSRSTRPLRACRTSSTASSTTVHRPRPPMRRAAASAGVCAHGDRAGRHEPGQPPEFITRRLPAGPRGSHRIHAH